MKNAINKIDLQLPILFTDLNGENRTVGDDVLSFLLKWDAEINNKLAIGSNVFYDINLLVQESKLEHQNFRMVLLVEMISRQSHLDKQQLIEAVSIYFIRLMNMMFEFTKTKDLSNQLKEISEKICFHFQQTFDFIEDFFGRYIYKERIAPSSYIEIIKVEVVTKFERAKTNFVVTTYNDNSLIDKVISAIKEKLSETATISINSIKYISELADEILYQSKLPVQQNLKEILYGFNFNDKNFVMSEYERFEALSPDTFIKKERIRLLKQEQKIVNQIVVRLNCSWDFSMPSLKEQINGWLNEEIQYLSLGIIVSNNQKDNVENYDKIQTSLSVAKLALLLRLLVLDKIIINRQVAPVLRTITKVFATLQKDEISFGSLETKYHAPEKTTIVMVRDMLFKWINLMGKL